MKKLWVVAVLSLLSNLVPTTELTGQSIDQAGAQAIGEARPGFVLGLIQNGDVSFLDAWGHPGPGDSTALQPDRLYPFPALTELLVTATAQAMEDGELLDLDLPISRYFPLISRRLGSATLRQLLTHSSGLDDARVPSRFTWSEVMDQLNDAVLFTDPGFVHSHSRYSFPLAVRAIEKAARMPFTQLVEQAILAPLEMNRSTFDLEKAKEMGLAVGVERDPGPADPDQPRVYIPVAPTDEVNGLPVLFTTAEDVLAFVGSWMAGGIRGTKPWADNWAGEGTALPGDDGIRGGLEVDDLHGHLRTSTEALELGTSGSLTLLPEAQTALVILGSGYIPTGARQLALDRIIQSLGLGPGMTENEITLSLKPTIIPHHKGGWTGRFLNGDRKVQLTREGEGLVYHTNVELLDVEPATNGLLAVKRRPTGRTAMYMRLVLDRQGRRYAVVDGKAFIHENDKRVYPHGG